MLYYSLLISALCAFDAAALPVSSTNATSSSSNNDGGPNLKCVQATWTDIATFFIGNYFAHATTVKSEPGEGLASLVTAILSALFCPSSGLIRGLTAIFRNAKFKRKHFASALLDNDYQTAAQAGALCMVVRTPHWKPQLGDEVADVILRERARVKTDPPGRLKMFFKPRLERILSEHLVTSLFKSWSDLSIFALKVEQEMTECPLNIPKQLEIYRPPWVQERSRLWKYEDTSLEYVLPTTAVQGFHDFKDQDPQYALAHVPMDAVIEIPKQTDMPTSQSPPNIIRESTKPGIISGSFSIPKALVAIFQLIYAVSTLYRSRGNEITRYGYAAFSLSVIPYAIMSLFNLLGALLTPDYPALTMVSSDVMDEAMRRGAQFDGVMGRLVPDTDPTTAKIKVLPPRAEDNDGSSSLFSYTTDKVTKEFPVVFRNSDRDPLSALFIEEGSNIPHLPATILVPIHSKFRRVQAYQNDLNVNVTYLTDQNVSTFEEYNKPRTFYYTTHLVCLVYGGVVFGIIGAISKFDKGESTHSQRVWLMLWYSWGILLGIVRQDRMYKEYSGIGSLVDTFYLCTPAIGGLVVVGQMMKAYGTCTPDAGK